MTLRLSGFSTGNSGRQIFWLQGILTALNDVQGSGLRRGADMGGGGGGDF